MVNKNGVNVLTIRLSRVKLLSGFKRSRARAFFYANNNLFDDLVYISIQKVWMG